MDASQRVDALQDALTCGATAIRSRLKLIPAGGEGDMVTADGARKFPARSRPRSSA